LVRLVDNQPTLSPSFGSDLEDEIKYHLTTTFGLQSFRQHQAEAIQATLTGHDVFVLMPTGGGKSLCYQLAALCRKGATSGVTVVVSPLLALMRNQVTKLEEKNIDVVLWNSQTKEHNSDIVARLKNTPTPALLYVSPEKVRDSEPLKSALKHLYGLGKIARFVVDEAHCISTWGFDFREAVRTLSEISEPSSDNQCSTQVYLNCEKDTQTCPSWL
jgi:superfamily II DNA helicase RecQ